MGQRAHILQVADGQVHLSRDIPSISWFMKLYILPMEDTKPYKGFLFNVYTEFWRMSPHCWTISDTSELVCQMCFQ